MRTLAVVLAGLALATGLVFYGLRRVEKMGGRPEVWARRGKPAPYNDFAVYVEASRRIGDDPGLYGRTLTGDGRRYIYPPLLAALLRPLAGLSTTAAATVWYLVGLLATAIGTTASVAIATGPRAPPRDRAFAWVAGLLVALTFFDDDFRNSNANALVFALTSVGGLAFLRGRPLAGGVSFAAAVAVKLTPVLVLAWLLVRGAWRESLALLAGLLLWFVLVPSALLGPAQNATLLSDYATRFVLPWADATVRPDNLEGPPGFSVRPLLVRPLSAETWPTKWNEPRIRVASLSPGLVRALVWAATAAILAATVLAWRRRRGRPERAVDPDLGPLHLSLVATAALLVSPVTFRANLLALFLPAAVLAVVWRRSRGSPDRRRALVLGLLLFAVLLNPWTDIGIVSRRIAGIGFALSFLFFSPFALWLALLLARRLVPLGPPVASPGERALP
jgi:hypothetical protein